jgi:hypothetical protein
MSRFRPSQDFEPHGRVYKPAFRQSLRLGHHHHACVSTGNFLKWSPSHLGGEVPAQMIRKLMILNLKEYQTVFRL